MHFHASLQREKEQTEAVVEEPKEGWWKPIYSVPIGIAAAIPVLQYEWYLVNEETQLMACFMMFTAVVYKNFGGAIHDMLSEDGKQIMKEHNIAEDEIIQLLKDKVEDIKFQSRIVQDAEDVHALKLQTFEKLNAAGKIKPLYEFKAQMEKLLAVVEVEETNLREKAKQSLMEDATAAVSKAFGTSADLKKQSLANSIAILKGTKASADPVKAAYLKFFQDKAAASKNIDVAAEAKEAREIIVTKLNAVAGNDGFFFEFDNEGKPKMIEQVV
jgi:hypothetical protein